MSEEDLGACLLARHVDPEQSNTLPVQPSPQPLPLPRHAEMDGQASGMRNLSWSNKFEV